MGLACCRPSIDSDAEIDAELDRALHWRPAPGRADSSPDLGLELRERESETSAAVHDGLVKGAYRRAGSCENRTG